MDRVFLRTVAQGGEEEQLVTDENEQITAEEVKRVMYGKENNKYPVLDRTLVQIFK